jgi:hypothetical protein
LRSNFRATCSCERYKPCAAANPIGIECIDVLRASPPDPQPAREIIRH